jgi:hypothetical protein
MPGAQPRAARERRRDLVLRGARLVDCSALLGSPSVPRSHGPCCAQHALESFVDRLLSGKGIRNLWLDEDDVGALSRALHILAAHAALHRCEVVFRSHVVSQYSSRPKTVAASRKSTPCALRFSSALFRSQVNFTDSMYVLECGSVGRSRTLRTPVTASAGGLGRRAFPCQSVSPGARTSAPRRTRRT